MPAHAQRMSSLLGADKEFAPCRESKGGRVIGGEVRAGRRERGYEAAASACTGPDSQKAGGQGHARRAHLEHAVHVRDAGGVEAGGGVTT